MSLSKRAAVELLRQRIEESCAVKRNFSQELLQAVLTLAQRTASAYRHGNKVLLMGNGGSAADAQHIAAELVGKFLFKTRKPLPAIALTTNSSILTAVSNDFGYEQSFVRQLQALGQAGDVVIAISTSGRSANVVRGVDTARARGCYTAAFTGKSGGQLKSRVDLLLAVPSEDTQRIQEAHGLLGHMFCELVERFLFAKEGVER